MFKKAIKIFSKEVVILGDGLEVWVVSWSKRFGKYSDDIEQAFQPFTSKESADIFAESLRNAFKLIGQTSGNTVTVSKGNNGL